MVHLNTTQWYILANFRSWPMLSWMMNNPNHQESNETNEIKSTLCNTIQTQSQPVSQIFYRFKCPQRIELMDNGAMKRGIELCTNTYTCYSETQCPPCLPGADVCRLEERLALDPITNDACTSTTGLNDCGDFCDATEWIRARLLGRINRPNNAPLVFSTFNGNIAFLRWV